MVDHCVELAEHNITCNSCPNDSLVFDALQPRGHDSLSCILLLSPGLSKHVHQKRKVRGAMGDLWLANEYVSVCFWQTNIRCNDLDG
eukprot:m.93731 g.93731  ORF g.93731 m.93731 type:complete len:87 (+) comp13007_c0_seq2:1068-1328(+)